MPALTLPRGVTTVGLLLLVVVWGVPARAAGVVGNGTRRSCTEAALDAALAGGGTVTFNCGPRPFTLIVTAPKSIAVDTTLDGGSLLTLSGGLKAPIFFVLSGGTFNLSNTTLARGRFSFGGAIFSDVGATLNVTNCTFSRNRAPGPGDGGAIDNYGTLTVINSTFARNSTGGVSGAIENNGTMTVTNCSFFRNRAVVGGAIGSAGPLTITNSTFFHNSTELYGSGGAIYSAGDTVVRNTILANSRRGGNCIGSVTDGGHNLRWPPTDTSCFGTYGDPKLGFLSDNGGGVQTLRLRAGSAAIDAGDPATCAAAPVGNLDQRGFARPGLGSLTCSIGAYEFNAAPPAP
jgi:predicted outer membrane repeat protein